MWALTLIAALCYIVFWLVHNLHLGLCNCAYVFIFSLFSHKVQYLQIGMAGVLHCGGGRVVVWSPAACGCVVHLLHGSLYCTLPELWFLFKWFIMTVLTHTCWKKFKFRNVSKSFAQ